MNNAELKQKWKQIFDDYTKNIEIKIVPDKNEPYNLDKAMVYMAHMKVYI